MRQALALMVAMVILGCATVPETTVRVLRAPPAPITAPKVVVFADRGDVKSTQGSASLDFMFGEQLRKQGFTVKRFADKGDTSIQFALELRGVQDSMACRGDSGPAFKWLEVYVIDMKSNEVVMVLKASGATENCITGIKFSGGSNPYEVANQEPVFGSLFDDLAKVLAQAWSSAQPAAPVKATTL